MTRKQRLFKFSCGFSNSSGCKGLYRPSSSQCRTEMVSLGFTRVSRGFYMFFTRFHGFTRFHEVSSRGFFTVSMAIHRLLDRYLQSSACAPPASLARFYNSQCARPKDLDIVNCIEEILFIAEPTALRLLMTHLNHRAFAMCRRVGATFLMLAAFNFGVLMPATPKVGVGTRRILQKVSQIASDCSSSKSWIW